MSSAAMVAAKLKAAAASIMLAFCLAIIISIAVLVKAGCLTESGLRLTAITQSSSPFYNVACVCAIIALIAACTWRLSVENMLFTLSGRRWLTLPFIFLIFPVYFINFNIVIHANWRYDAILWAIAQYAVWTLATMKLFLAAWTFATLRRRRMLTGDDIAYATGFWVFGVLCLFGILYWLIPRDLAPWHFWASCSVIAVPLVRMALGPLALAWNRHR